MLNKVTVQILILCLVFSTLLKSQSIGDISLTIVHSEKTKQMFYKENNLFNPIYDWEMFFLNNKFSYDVIDDDGLDNFDFRDSDVLILPSVEVLSDEAAENIKEYLKIGGGIFVIGQLGLYDESGRVRMKSILENIFGITLNTLPINKASSNKLEIEPSNTLSRSTNYNSDLLVLSQLTNYYSQNTSSELSILAKYDIQSLTEDVNDYPAIISGEQENGKLIWCGFQLSQLSASSNLNCLQNELVFNSIDWLADKPVVWVNQFPSNYESAALFTFEINNLKNFNDDVFPLIHNRKIESVYLLNPELIINSFEYLSALSINGEINILMNEKYMKNKSKNFIAGRLNGAYRILNGETDQNTFGLFTKNVSDNSFYLSMNTNVSLDFYVDQSYKIFFADTDENVNNIYSNLNYEVTDLTAFDLKNERQPLNEKLNEGFESSDIVNILLLSEKYNNSDLSTSDMLDECISAVSLNNSWLTNYSQLIEWIKNREKLAVNIERMEGDEMFVVKLTNNGDQIVENVGLSLTLPSSKKYPGQISYNYQMRFNQKTGLYNLLIPFVKPHQTLIIDVRYD